MTIGKSIRVYLDDATVTGIRYAELVNWTGQAIVCPRNRLNELKNWPEASKPGVYFLFEGHFSDIKPLAYIGESEDVAGRLTSHDRNKDFWSEVVIFTSKDSNLTKAHIKYLESSLVTISKNANRYNLENGNFPAESSLPRADSDAMKEFIENMRMVIGVLGYSILEPIFKSKQPNNLDGVPESTEDLLSNLFFSVNNISARGAVTDEGFVLKEGSQFSTDNTESIPSNILSMKNQYIANGKIIDDNGTLVASEDILLSSASYAAAIVAGTSRSGPQSWKTASGKTMKKVEDESLKNA